VSTTIYDKGTDKKEWIIRDSCKRLLTSRDLKRLDKEKLQIAVNEIYARHGYRFKDEDIRAYFDSLTWYHGIIPAESFDEAVFNSVELSNLKLLKEERENR